MEFLTSEYKSQKEKIERTLSEYNTIFSSLNSELKTLVNGMKSSEMNYENLLLELKTIKVQTMRKC